MSPIAASKSRASTYNPSPCMSLCTKLQTSLSIVQFQTSLSIDTMLLEYSPNMTVDPRFL